MIRPSLDDAYLRVKRAGEHITALRRMQRKIGIDPDTITSVPLPEAEEKRPDADGGIRLRPADLLAMLGVPDFIVPDPPPDDPRWSIRFGECIYNLRVALDYLAYSLAYLDSGAEPEQTQFLVSRTHAAFDKDAKIRLVGVNEVHRDVIEAMQPYNGTDFMDGKWLAQLAAFSNPDKHRRLSFVSTDMRGITSWRIRAGPRRPEDVAFTASRFISFGDSEKTPVIQTLHGLRQHVIETLDLFKADFAVQ